MRKGDFIGYDLTEKIKKDTKAAILPIGYWHGFPRVLSQKGIVLLSGRRARVLGRVSMDLTVVEIPPGTRIGVWDKATLIGESGKDVLTAEEIAELAGTSNYEFLTRINPLIERTII
jgi:alanine racemase